MSTPFHTSSAHPSKFLGVDFRGSIPSSSQLHLLERELEEQIKESLRESKDLQDRFQRDLTSLRGEMERRFSERSLHAKRKQTKLRDNVLSAERDKTDALHYADLLQQQLIIVTSEVRLAKDRILELEAETQSLRAWAPKMVERADSASVAEASRVRDRSTVIKEQPNRAQREAADARQEVGRLHAINQGLQRDVDNARHRLLTVQGSLAESVEEVAGLKQNLEAERIKTVAGSHRLKDAVQRRDAALGEIRHDSVRLREQRDSFGQDCVVLATKLQRLKKEEGCRRIFRTLQCARNAVLTRAIGAWMIWAVKDDYIHKQTHRQEKHNGEIASLEADILSAKRRYVDSQQYAEGIRRSRAGVAEAVAKAVCRRGGLAAAAEERGGGSQLQWCFWGWARIAREGEDASATRARRVAAERELRNIADKLQVAIDRAQTAENSRDKHREEAEALCKDITRRDSELVTALLALNATDKLVSVVRNRCISLGATRLHKILGQVHHKRLLRLFNKWIDVLRPSSPPGEESSTMIPPPNAQGFAYEEEVLSFEQVYDGEGQRAKRVTPDMEASGLGGDCREEMDTERSLNAAHSFVPVRQPGESLLANEESVSGFSSSAASSQTDPQCLTKPFVNEEAAMANQSERAEVDAPTLPQDHNPWLDTVPISGVSVRRCSIQSNDKNTRRNLYDKGGDILLHSHADTDISSPKIAVNNTDDIKQVSRSLLSHIPTDLPRLMLALRIAVGHELYAAGERLFRCVEADHGEMHGKPYLPVSLTGAERAQFRACLEDTCNGSLRQGVSALLRVQEASRKAAMERKEAKKVILRSGGSARDDMVQLNGKSSGPMYEGSLPTLASFLTSPLSSRAEKNKAARVLRNRLVVLLEAAAEVWSARRRPWERVDILSTPKTKTRKSRSMKFGERARRWADANKHPPSPLTQLQRRGYSLDSGAGPRRFWEAVCGPRFVDAAWDVELKVLEDQLWKLAVLVREQDRGQGLALKRADRLRRVLDLRVYDILVLHLRTQLLRDGVDFTVSDTSHGREVAPEGSLQMLLIAADKAMQTLDRDSNHRDRSRTPA